MIRRVMTLTWLAFAGNFSTAARTPIDVPYAVEIAFAERFPGAFYQKWEFLRDFGLYETRFVYENQSYVAYFEEDGPFVASIMVINELRLPPKVKRAIDNLYPHCEFIRVEELWLNDELSYVAEIMSRDHVSVLRISSKGKMTSVQEKSRHYMQKKKFLRKVA